MSLAMEGMGWEGIALAWRPFGEMPAEGGRGGFFILSF